VRKPEDVHFLGFRFRCKKDGEVAVLPSGKARERLKATVREMTPPNWGRSINACMEDISRYLTGWMSHYRLCTADAAQGLGVVDEHVRRRIRAIIVRQKKRQRFLFRHLRARGVSVKTAAGCAYSGKGAWVKSNLGALTRAYPPSWFHGRMASLKTLWERLHTPPVSAQLVLGF